MHTSSKQATPHPSSYYNAYGPWLKQKYNGQKIFKVIVDAGFSCPNRDGSKAYGGCAYCNVDSFTPANARLKETIPDQLHASMERAKSRYNADKFIVYFQPNTNTHAPVEELQAIYDQALAVNPEETIGLSIGTRPDCLDQEKIQLIESYTSHLDVDIELGMESIYESTLQKINRACTHQELLDTLELLKDSPISTCLHTIFGFPWETHQEMLAYADEINRFPNIQFIKLHHLHIVKGSILGAQYQKQPFPLFSLDDYTNLLADFLPRLRPDIVIQRLFGVADKSLLIGPEWGLSKTAVQSHLDHTLTSRGVKQGSIYRL